MPITYVRKSLPTSSLCHSLQFKSSILAKLTCRTASSQFPVWGITKTCTCSLQINSTQKKKRTWQFLYNLFPDTSHKEIVTDVTARTWATGYFPLLLLFLASLFNLITIYQYFGAENSSLCWYKGSQSRGRLPTFPVLYINHRIPIENAELVPSRVSKKHCNYTAKQQIRPYP